jgi:hypothetical protein
VPIINNNTQFNIIVTPRYVLCKSINTFYSLVSLLLITLKKVSRSSKILHGWRFHYMHFHTVEFKQFQWRFGSSRVSMGVNWYSMVFIKLSADNMVILINTSVNWLKNENIILTTSAKYDKYLQVCFTISQFKTL